MIKPPKLPFPEYKWRWASVAPTESLNSPPVFLGVLRALCRHEGERPSSLGLLEDLGVVQKETNTDIDLVRTPDRNLMRNSQQYWKALGVVESTRPIKISQFGKEVCAGDITPSEFAATVVATLTLPNKAIQQDSSSWEKAGLEIKPLQLILEILSMLRAINSSHAYITLQELTRIVIPLAGAQVSVRVQADAIVGFRQGIVSTKGWPDCTPKDNDPRMAREFLLFLSHYGYCELIEKENAVGGIEERFVISEIESKEIQLLSEIPRKYKNIGDVLSRVRKTSIPDDIDRRRVLREVTERPYQAAFRENVFRESAGQCLITGVKIAIALEAAHIVPVSHKGSDKTGNGICLRKDIHQLFDSQHIRIRPDGHVFRSEIAEMEPCYKALPERIVIPKYVDVKNLDWRWKYL